jgi:hypothetical protein
MKFILPMIVALAAAASAMESSPFISDAQRAQLADMKTHSEKLKQAPPGINPAGAEGQTDETPPPIVCFDKAMAGGKLNETYAAKLCSGTFSADAPIACFDKATALGWFSGWGAERLCEAAPSADAPLACFGKAMALGSLSFDGAVDLCIGSDSADASIACFNKVLALWPDSRVEFALDLCGRAARNH